MENVMERWNAEDAEEDAKDAMESLRPLRESAAGICQLIKRRLNAMLDG
jgi:hypothetical protein